MARNENPPFDRGATYGTTTLTDGAQYEGHEWVFEDLDYSVQGAKPARTNRYVRCRIVRNVAAAALLPGRLARFIKTAGNYGAQVDGYTATTAERGYPIDEWLPAAGVAVNDLFWIVVDGPAAVKTDLAGGANNVINVGDVLVALTGATSGATTAGRVAPQDLTGATALLANQQQNRIGYALTARTTGNTDASVLVEVGRW